MATREINGLQEQLATLTATMDQFVEHAKIIWQAIDELRENVDYRLAQGHDARSESGETLKAELTTTLFQVIDELRDDVEQLLQERLPERERTLSSTLPGWRSLPKDVPDSDFQSNVHSDHPQEPPATSAVAPRRDTPCVLPVIHINGTSKASLVEGLCDAIHSLHDARKKLAQTAPNGRDYYPDPGRMDLAQRQHDRRMNTLRELSAEMSEYVSAIDKLPEPGDQDAVVRPVQPSSNARRRQQNLFSE